MIINVDSLESFDIEAGRVPVTEFVPIFRYSSLVSENNEVGIVPFTFVVEKVRYDRDVNKPISDGIEPVIDVDCVEIARCCKFVRRPIPVATVPFIFKFDRPRLTKLVIL
jgi:hypothetical protein